MEKTEKIKSNIKKIRDSSFFRAFAVNILFFSFAVLLCEQKYEVSDDFVMETILSGAYGGGVNPRILFSNTIYGYILAPLYRIWPDISWYFILQLVSGLISFTAISYILFRELDMLRACFFTVFMLAFFSNDIYILTNFTKTAGICIMAGSVLVLYALFQSHKKGQLAAGMLLCVLGSLQRFQSLYLAGPFIAAVLLVEFARFFITQRKENGHINIKDRRFLKILIGGFSLIALILLCKFAGDMTYKSSEEYRDYKRYAAVRADIVDAKYYNYSVYKDDFERLGISENDFAMLHHWNFADPEYFTVEKLENISETIINNNSLQPVRWRQILKDMRNREYLKYPVVIACVIMLVIGLVRNTRKWWFYIGMAGICGCMLMYFFVRGRVLYRVEYPIFLGLFVSVMYITLLKIRHNKYGLRIGRIASVLGILLFVLFQIRIYVPDNSYKSVRTDDRKKYLDAVFDKSWNYDERKYRRVTDKWDSSEGLIAEIKANPDNFYMLDFNTTIQSLYYDWNVYESLGKGYYDNFAYLSGVTMEYPDVNRLFEKNGIKNPLKDLVKDGVYLVDNANCDEIIAYLKEHYFPDANAVFIKSVEGYKIWKINAE